MARNFFTFPSVTLITLLEILLVNTRYSQLAPSGLPRSQLFLFIAAANYVFLLLWTTRIYPVFFHPLRRFPAPKINMVSRIFTQLGSSLPPGQALLDMAECTPNDGVMVLQGHGECLLLTKPGVLGEVLVQHPYDFAKPSYARDFMRPVLADGLVIVEGERHQFLRKHVQTGFKLARIRALYPAMMAKAARLVEVLGEDEVRGSAGSVVDVSVWAGKATFDTIMAAALGCDLDVLRRPHEPLLKLYAAVLQPSTAAFVHLGLLFLLPPDVVRLLPFDAGRSMREAGDKLRLVMTDLIRQRRAAILSSGSLDDGSDGRVDILSELIKDGFLSEDDMVDQLLTFMPAGYESTASTVSWIMYLLAVHPEWQDKLRAEVGRALPDFAPLSNDEKPGYDDSTLAAVLERLPYLNGIVNETLRLYPSLPVTARVAARDTSIAGHAVEKGTEIVLSAWLVNRYTAVWGADACVFRPERWITPTTPGPGPDGEKDDEARFRDGTPNNTGGVAGNNYAHMTFLHGPRNCIGQGFARAELRCLTAALTAAFSWRLAMDPRRAVPVGVIASRPAHGMFLHLERVKR
ncbi:cytochrome P450 [Lasiosphaeria miniovina]|uniref:Cytochrome P450 n=1 Tax=Lasiosphaeria miniovina TaxID=1954250 RepID=A0AA40ACH2_9PEZI|nr:cytochrome P450 [Lasiosphaeria miniovina]KAK0713321.1 cytochrome P450 [Lasiosphaeria miniovina]